MTYVELGVVLRLLVRVDADRDARLVVVPFLRFGGECNGIDHVYHRYVRSR